MKRFFWSCCVVSIGLLLAPSSSFSAHMNVGCADCHQVSRVCVTCHDDDSTRDTKAIEVATHSSDVIGSAGHYEFAKECLDCHDPHQPNGFVLGPDGGIFDDDIIKVDLMVNYAVWNQTDAEVTFDLEEVDVQDADWADPATWAEKSEPGRGLMFVMYYDQYQGYVSYEVVGATANSITIGENYRMFPAGNNPINAQLIYGMLLKNEVNGATVKAAGPTTFAYDESGTGTDPTPDGICQVCHTQTTHWLNDGSLADHFIDWKCTICHSHKLGFRVDPPSMSSVCSLVDETPQQEWDCNGIWGGDNVLDNCGTCDNDPSNDCLEDCNGIWGGDGQLDDCGVCDGDSTVYPGGSPCDLADRSGTVTVAETGLMWQQDTADVDNNGLKDTGDKLIFNDAMDYCNGLLFAGYTDWHLPTKDQLKGLVLCVDSSGATTTVTPLADGAYCEGSYVRPTIDQSLFDSITASYWSDGPSRPWITNFLHGRTWITANDIPYYIRCVRND